MLIALQVENRIKNIVKMDVVKEIYVVRLVNVPTAVSSEINDYSSSCPGLILILKLVQIITFFLVMFKADFITVPILEFFRFKLKDSTYVLS